MLFFLYAILVIFGSLTVVIIGFLIFDGINTIGIKATIVEEALVIGKRYEGPNNSNYFLPVGAVLVPVNQSNPEAFFLELKTSFSDNLDFGVYKEEFERRKVGDKVSVRFGKGRITKKPFVI